VALDPVSGAVRWRSPLQLAFGAPEQPGDLVVASVVHGGVVAFTTVDGQLHGSDDRTGTERWHRSVPSTPSAASPAPHGRSIYPASSPLRSEHDGVVCVEPAPPTGGPGPGPIVTAAFDIQTGEPTGNRQCFAPYPVGLLPVEGGPIVRLHAG